MPLTLNLREHPEEGGESMAYIPTRRLWLAKDGETVVEDGDLRAGTLLTVPGRSVTDSFEEQYGLAAVEARLDEDISPASAGTPPLKQDTKADESVDDPDPDGDGDEDEPDPDDGDDEPEDETETEEKAEEPAEDKAQKPVGNKAASRRRSRRAAVEA